MFVGGRLDDEALCDGTHSKIAFAVADSPVRGGWTEPASPAVVVAQ